MHADGFLLRTGDHTVFRLVGLEDIRERQLEFHDDFRASRRVVWHGEREIIVVRGDVRFVRGHGRVEEADCLERDSVRDLGVSRREIVDGFVVDSVKDGEFEFVIGGDISRWFLDSDEFEVAFRRKERCC